MMPAARASSAVKKRPVRVTSVAKAAAPRKFNKAPVFGASEAARGLGHLEFGPRGGDNQIAFEDDAERQTHRIAVRCGDDRLPVDRPSQQITGIGAPALRPAMLQKFFAPAQLPLMHIGAARKGAAVATCPIRPR